MSHAMNGFTDTTTNPIERTAPSRHAQSLLQRAGLTLLMAAAWGVAAGSARPMLAVLNIYKVPMVLTLSLLVALPAVLVTRSLFRIAVKISSPTRCPSHTAGACGSIRSRAVERPSRRYCRPKAPDSRARAQSRLSYCRPP